MVTCATKSALAPSLSVMVGEADRLPHHRWSYYGSSFLVGAAGLYRAFFAPPFELLVATIT
jgi:hypothetical protein